MLRQTQILLFMCYAMIVFNLGLVLINTKLLIENIDTTRNFFHLLLNISCIVVLIICTKMNKRLIKQIKEEQTHNS